MARKSVTDVDLPAEERALERGFDRMFERWERQRAGVVKGWETRRARYGEKGHRPNAYMRNKVVKFRARVRARCHLRLAAVDGRLTAPPGK